MDKKKVTPIFIFSTIVLIAIYDVFIILNQGNQESISAHILSMGEVTPFIPALLGFTFGHLTWPNKDSFLHKRNFKPYSYLFFLLITPPAVYDVACMYIIENDFIFKNYNLSPFLPFVASYILGHFFWPMEPIKWSGRFKK